MKRLCSAIAIAVLMAVAPTSQTSARPMKPGDPKEGTCELVSVGFWVCSQDGKVYWCTSKNYSKDACEEAPYRKRPTLRNMRSVLSKKMRTN